MKILCLILARGGSKRVPRKNIRLLGGKPLLEYTIDCAKESRYINRIIVSTDDDEIASVALKCGAEVPFRRPAQISGADSTELDAFKHALSWLEKNEGYTPDLIVKLFTTSPFRKPVTVDKAIKLLLDHPEADSVRSVCRCSEHPHKMWTIDASGKLKSLIPVDQKLPQAHTLSYHLLPETYIQNASIDVTRPSNIWKKSSITGTIILPLIMDEQESLDLNTALDFGLAEMLLDQNLPEVITLIDEDLEGYSNYMDYRVDRCIVCGEKKTTLWAKYGSFTAVKCESCDMIWINPMVNPEGTGRYYQDYIGMRFDDKDKTAKRKIQYQIDRDYLQEYVNGGKILDIGCSGGFFLASLSDRFDKYGLEIDEEAVNYAKKHYPFGNNVIAGDLLKTPLPECTFDVITMRGVIEHLHDPVSALGKVSKLLKKGGYFYIAATPNALSFSADFYRERWNQFHPIRHLYYFSIQTLPAICKRYGLRLVSYRLPYIETPYASVNEDIRCVARDIKLKSNNLTKKIPRSPAFWENMMNLVFIKD